MEVSEDWGELVEPAEGAGPIVYHFRPTRFVKVAPERLEEWERVFVENTGLAFDAQRADRLRPDWSQGSQTLSYAGGSPSDCDFV